MSTTPSTAEREPRAATEQAYRESLLEQFATRAARLPGAGLPWLDAHRRDAIDSFAEMGFPTTRLEDWKYTSVAPITRIGFQPVNGTPSSTGGIISAIGPFESGNITRLVFVDGVFRPENSQIGHMPAGAWVTGLRRVIEHQPELLEPFLARHADHHHHPFTALNTAFMSDGAFIQIPAGSHKELPIHLMYISTRRRQPVIVHPRNLVVAGPGSQVSIIEHYVGAEDAVYLNNAVTEINAAPDAVVEHYKLQHESPTAFHLATLQIDQQRSSSVTSHSIAAGAALARHEINTRLGDEGADCALYGLYMLDGKQHADHTIRIDHARPRCSSRQNFKGILNDASRGIFSGRIIVREDAQQTSAQQSNKNLLLSDRTRIESRPQLEIYADDVQCTHGSATGHLDQESIFYLRSRGISEADARKLLTYAFAREILQTIRVKLFRTNMEELFTRWLPAGRMLGGTN